MGKRLDRWISVVRKTGKGSDYLGPCECCGKHGSDFEAASNRFIWVRDNGQHYLGGGTEIYGHHGCLLSRFVELVGLESLKRDGSIYLLPDWAAEQDHMSDKSKDNRPGDE